MFYLFGSRQQIYVIHQYPTFNQTYIAASKKKKITAEEKKTLLLIVAGVDALYGASPWIASIRRSKNFDICAASLIDNQHLVTAAHCFGG